MSIEEMYEEWQKCLNDEDYFIEKYCVVTTDGGAARIDTSIPDWMKVFELVQPVRAKAPDEVGARQRLINAIQSELQWLNNKKP